MKQILTQSLLLFFLTTLHCFAQTSAIEIIQSQENETIILSVKNNTAHRKEVTLTIKGNGFEKIPPVTKLVDKGETIEFSSVKPIVGQQFKFTTSYTYIDKPTADEINNNNRRIEGKKPGPVVDFSKGITVFTKEGCPRCNKTLNYLLDNHINFVNMDIIKNPEYSELMWEKLGESNITGEIIMPVIIINGKLTHSHKNLDSFLKKIK